MNKCLTGTYSPFLGEKIKKQKNMAKKIVVFPTAFAILLAIGGLGIPIPGSTEGTPWLTAVHQQTMPDGQVVNVDNIAFFLWGHQYTVVGKISQSSFTTYDTRDFPFYSMIAIISAIVIGVLSIIADRELHTVIRGKEINLRFPDNVVITIIGKEIRVGISLLLLVLATILMGIATLYLDYSAGKTIIPLLQDNNYLVTTGNGFQLMRISVTGFAVAVLMTMLRREDSEDVIE